MSVTNNRGIDPDFSWRRAADYLRTTIHFASSFTATIRVLQQNKIENLTQQFPSNRMTEGSRFYVMRLLRAASVLAPFYYLTRTFKPQELENKTYVSLEELVSLYRVDEISSILALIYVFNTMRKVCDEEEWGRYSRVINETVELGGHLGSNIDEIGMADGLLLTGIRYLAPAIFLSRDAKIFKNYRRDTKIKKRAFDLQMEYDLFGCTHVEIAVQMIQSMGFGVEYASAFYKSIVTPPNKKLERHANFMRILLLWTEALYSGQKPPSIHGENEILVSEDMLDNLAIMSKSIQEKGSAYSWLSKGKSSITKELVPQLYYEDTDDFPDVTEHPFVG